MDSSQMDRISAALTGEVLSRPDAFLYCLEPCPFRAPHWRWQLACMSLEGNLPRRPELRDPWVVRLKRHLRRGSRNPDSPGPRRRRSSLAATIDSACELRADPDPLIPAEVEAWILADEPNKVVAKQCGLTVPVVAAYEKLFFDVRPRLNSQGYVLHRIIGPQFYQGFSVDDLGPIWKFYAYMQGRYSLELVLFTFPGSRPRPWPASFDVTPKERRCLVNTCRLSVLTKCLKREEATWSHLERLMELSNWIHEQLRENGDLSVVDKRILTLMDPFKRILEPECESDQKVTSGNNQLDLTIDRVEEDDHSGLVKLLSPGPDGIPLAFRKNGTLHNTESRERA